MMADEKPIPANDVEFEPDSDVTVTILRQPVISREQVRGKGGVLKLAREGYVRTKEPLEKREEKLVRFSRTRATVSWGGATPLVETAQFSLVNARCVGNADWILSLDSMREVRKIMLARFPKPTKAPTEPEEPEERSPMEIANETAPE